MAIKQVQETLGQFEDWKFFSVLESKKESNEDSKLEQEDEKDGLDVIKKLQDNLERFKSAAGDKILKYKEFWEENQKATDGFDEEGDLYKLWDSDYVVGVLTLPDEALSDEELEAEMEEVDGAVELEDDEESDETEEDDDDEKPGPEKGADYDEEQGEVPGEQDTGPDEYADDDDDDEEELEEGNAFSGALKKAKKEGKKEFKVGGKKYPVKESLIPKGEDFPLFEAEEEEDEDEGMLPAEGVVTPDEASDKEKKEMKDQEGFKGFEEPGSEEEEDTDEFSADDEVEVEDGEAVELDGDLDGDGEEEGGMEFAGESGESQYLVVYNVNGGREEVFRCSSPRAIEEFKDFFENQFKASIKEQIQKFKQAQEEKKAEEERKAKEAIRAERKSKLEKFMKA